LAVEATASVAWIKSASQTVHWEVVGTAGRFTVTPSSFDLSQASREKIIRRDRRGRRERWREPAS
jgi:predicted dehydrogenase